MSSITFLQPNKKLSLYNIFSHSATQEKKGIRDLLKKTFQFNISAPAVSSFTKNCSWEYFSNELEYE